MDRELQHICKDLLLLEERGGVKGFFEEPWNSRKLGGLVEDIRNAMIEYQVCIHNPTISSASDTLTRPRYSKTSTTRAVSSL